MRNRILFVKNYLKEVFSGRVFIRPESGMIREENLALYRNSRAIRSAECPNLPIILQVEVSSRCNLKCRMCNIHHDTLSGRIIPDKLLDLTMDLSRTASIVSPFGLGEPLLHPEITTIVGRYKSLGATVQLVTNGMLLDEKISEGFILNGLDHLGISLDAADPVLLSKLRRGADFKRIYDNIRKLNRLKKTSGSSKPVLLLKVVVQGSNITQLGSIIRLAEELEIFSIEFSPITVHKHIAEIQNEALDPGLEGWRETLSLCANEAAERGISVNMQRLHYVLSGSPWGKIYKETAPCPDPFRFMVIRANGDVFPCCNWDVNKPIAHIVVSQEMSVTDMEKIWRSPDWRALREKIVSQNYPEECKACMMHFTRPF